MANTYYDSDLTGEQIEQALEAIDGVIVPANNGKVLAINNGKLEARSVQWDADLGPKSITENGTYNPASDNLDGYSQVTVNVSGSGGTTDANHVTYNSSETYDSGTVGAALNEQRNTLNQLDTEVDAAENGLAIPQTGDTCTKTGGIPKGAFIFLQGHSTLTDGIYQNTSGNIISSGSTFTSSNLTRCYQETGALNLLNSGLMATAKVYRRSLASSSNLNAVFYPSDVACMVITSGSVKAGYGTATIVTGYITGSRMSHTDLKSESTIGYDFSSTTECKFAIINNATNSGITITILDFLGTFKEWSGGTPFDY